MSVNYMLLAVCCQGVVESICILHPCLKFRSEARFVVGNCISRVQLLSWYEKVGGMRTIYFLPIFTIKWIPSIIFEL